MAAKDFPCWRSSKVRSSLSVVASIVASTPFISEAAALEGQSCLSSGPYFRGVLPAVEKSRAGSQGIGRDQSRIWGDHTSPKSRTHIEDLVHMEGASFTAKAPPVRPERSQPGGRRRGGRRRRRRRPRWRAVPPPRRASWRRRWRPRHPRGRSEPRIGRGRGGAGRGPPTLPL